MLGASKPMTEKQQKEFEGEIRNALGKLSPDKKDLSKDDLRRDLMKQFRPVSDIDFRNLFTKWIGQFHDKYLSLPSKKSGYHSGLVYNVFHV